VQRWWELFGASIAASTRLHFPLAAAVSHIYGASLMPLRSMMCGAMPLKRFLRVDAHGGFSLAG